jgi:hypothetical protein
MRTEKSINLIALASLSASLLGAKISSADIIGVVDTSANTISFSGTAQAPILNRRPNRFVASFYGATPTHDSFLFRFPDSTFLVSGAPSFQSGAWFDVYFPFLTSFTLRGPDTDGISFLLSRFR